MARLILIDFMYLAYRHFYAVEQYEANHDGHYMMSNPTTGEESARLYYIMRDLETIIRSVEDENTDIVVCMDRPSMRKESENGSEYKANRANRLNTLAINAIVNVTDLLCQSGISNCWHEGYEADDIIQSIVKQYSNRYDEILIFTPDSDLSVLIDNKVSLMRYKSVYSANRYGSGHQSLLDAHAHITRDNFTSYFSKELSKKGGPEVVIDYNAMMFYKVTVGDTSDNIKGIKGFGNAAYTRIRNILIKNGMGQMLSLCSNEGSTEILLRTLQLNGYINDTQLAQALEALDYVRPRIKDIEPEYLIRPILNKEERKDVYYKTWGIQKI